MSARELVKEAHAVADWWDAARRDGYMVTLGGGFGTSDVRALASALEEALDRAERAEAAFDVCVLSFVSTSPALDDEEIADRLGVDVVTASMSLRRLEKRGCICEAEPARNGATM